ncbi:MAG: acyltransferase family protein [Eubacterium sp.]
MILVFALCLLFLILSALGVGTKGKWAFSKPVSRDNGYCSRELTSSINGYFLTTVFMTHLIQYMETDIYGPLDFMYTTLNRALGQLIVAMFLFYSGFGVMESIRCKEAYIISFPKRRLLPFFVNFEIAALMYLFVSCVIGETPTFHYAIKGFLAWESLGNSNWYVFAILYLYIATYVVFRLREFKIIQKIPMFMGVFGVAFLSGIYVLWMRHEGKGGWWYDTIFCYCAGMFFALCRTSIETWLASEKAHLRYVSSLVLAATVFGIFYAMRADHKMYFEIISVSFAILVVLLTMRFRASNRIYTYIGQNIFSFYIFQRIPMIFLKDTIGKVNPCLYLFVCAILTVGISLVMIRFYGWLKKYLP